MIAYYVHDDNQPDDRVIIPEMGCAVTVTKALFEAFIGVRPSFAKWSGDACGSVSPEDFGTVIATREEGGDVCVLKDDLWKERMAHYLAD